MYTIIFFIHNNWENLDWTHRIEHKKSEVCSLSWIIKRNVHMYLALNVCIINNIISIVLYINPWLHLCPSQSILYFVPSLKFAMPSYNFVFFKSRCGSLNSWSVWVITHFSKASFCWRNTYWIRTVKCTQARLHLIGFTKSEKPPSRAAFSTPFGLADATPR